MFDVLLQHVWFPREPVGDGGEASQWADRVPVPDGGTSGYRLASSRGRFLPRLWRQGEMIITISILHNSGADPGGGARGPGPPPLTTKNEAPAPKFYKTEAPEWQF